jgi:hypothetical protein
MDRPTIGIFQATYSLVGGQMTWGNGEVIFHDGQTPPTKAEVDAEIIRLQAEEDSQEYARNRQPEYPDIGDQLDDLYHKGAFSDEMAVKIKAVKDAHPKPE